LLQARTLHVCGDPAALPLLQRLVDECGDELEVGHIILTKTQSPKGYGSKRAEHRSQTKKAVKVHRCPI
jgi:hypothetical protein